MTRARPSVVVREAGPDAAWRGQGIGRALLTALELYRPAGFQTVGGDAGHPTTLLRLVRFGP